MQDVQDESIKYIKKDRDHYQEVWELIEEYCEHNKLIISNIYVLLDQSSATENIYNKTYNIYCANPLVHGNNLTNILHEKTKNIAKKFTKFKTIKEHEEFTIEYDMRIVATLYKVQKYKSMSKNKHPETKDPNEIIKPVDINKILYMPAEIEMIDIYHTLYDASKFDQYETSIEMEKKLYEQYVIRREKGYLGGDKSCVERKKDLLEAIKLSIVRDWLTKHDNLILIGTWAYNWILQGVNICTDVEKIQLIGDISHNELLSILQRYISEFTKFQISVREQELHIPKDFRTRRYTYYIHIVSEHGVVEKPFLDLFNCCNFEIIPFTKVSSVNVNGISSSKDKVYTINVGNKYVILRFLFIDLWILRLIKNMGFISKDILDKKMDRIIAMIEKIRNKYGEELQEYNFLGIFKNYDIDKKKITLQGKKFYPYIPEIYLKQNGKYRVINPDRTEA